MQYEVSPAQYLANMRKPSEWGGGPEIVVLANVLKRPIHVYELQPICDDEADDAKSSCGGGGGSSSNGGGSSGGSYSGGSCSGGSSRGGRWIPGSGMLRRTLSARHSGAATAFAARGGGISLSSPSGSEGWAPSGWRLRRIACFGSPKFDRANPAVHILSADSRFPDLKPGDQLPNGNHFLALFPEDLKEAGAAAAGSAHGGLRSSSGRRAHAYAAAPAAAGAAAAAGGWPWRWRWPRRGNDGGSLSNSSKGSRCRDSGGSGGFSGAGVEGSASAALARLSELVRRAASALAGRLSKGATAEHA
jgi:hypothetical protein